MANEIERLLAENKRLRNGLEDMFGVIEAYGATCGSSKAVLMLLDSAMRKRALLNETERLQEREEVRE